MSWGWQSSNLCGPPPAAQTCTSKASLGLRLGHFAKPLREIVGGKPLAGLEPTRGWQRPSSGESGGEGWPRVPGVAFGRGRCQLEDGIGLWPFVAAEVYSVSQSGVRKGDRATRLWQGERGQSRERRGSGHTPVAGSKSGVKRVADQTTFLLSKGSRRGSDHMPPVQRVSQERRGPGHTPVAG